VNWLRVLFQIAGPGRWREMREDFRHLARALRLREVISRPSIGQMLLDGTINALRDLSRSPRANLPAAGSIRLHFTVAGQRESAQVPASWRRWFQRLAPVLASVASRIYSNNDSPLAHKLPEASRLVLRQINILDVIAAAVFGFAAGISGVFLAAWDRFLGVFRRRRGIASAALYPRYNAAARQACDLTPLLG